RSARGHSLDQDHAEALTGERGRAEQIGLAKLAPEDRVRDLPQHVDVGHHVGIAYAPGDLLGIRADDGQAGGDVLDQRLESRKQHGKPLALFGATHEEEAELLAWGLWPLWGSLDVDAVGDDRVLAAEPASPRPGCGLG